MGVRLRRLREERSLTQTAVAQALGISNSYLSQIEQNQRPLTVPLLLKLNAAFGVDVQLFSEDEEGRLISDVREALGEGGAEHISTAELRELALNMPAVGRALVALHRKSRRSADRAEAMALRLGEEFADDTPARMPFEQVRDFFYSRRNHVAELDEAAERLYAAAGLTPRQVRPGLAAWLAKGTASASSSMRVRRRSVASTSSIAPCMSRPSPNRGSRRSRWRCNSPIWRRAPPSRP